MLKSVINPARGRLRVLGYCSGSGNTLWKAYELQLAMEATPEGCPFEIVGIFADNPESKAVETARRFGVPAQALDIRQYYARRDKPLRDREVRAEYDREALSLVSQYRADVILLAGYVWATTDVLLDEYLVVNVHPGDLALTDETGRRVLAGANGIQAALDRKLPYLRASSHIATRELDAGPLLVRSAKVPVDYALHTNPEERFRYYLKLVNEQSRLVGARTLLELALGSYQTDEQNRLYFRGELAPGGFTVENWGENRPAFERHPEKLLRPESVAVIGASARPGIGNAIVQNLQDIGYPGKVYAVNRKAERVMGVPGYASVLDIPDKVDLAVLSVPSSSALSVAEECGKKGIPALVCITAGFREIGGEGVERERALMRIVNRYNMCMIGPNCMGIANTDRNVRLSATILSQTPPAGHVAFLTQSGALGASIIDFAGELDVGFSVVASLGNMASINPCDLLPMLERDPNTELICMYMETIPQPWRFEKVMRGITKPVILVKSGRTAAGAAAASSHTGSLAGNDSVADALIAKCGILRAENLEDAFLLASAMSKMPRLHGRRVGIISNAGGLGTLTTDALVKYGFLLPELDAPEREALAAQLLPEASTHNPLDLVAPAPPSHYAIAARAMIASGKYDAIIVDCVPPATIDTGEVAQAMVDILHTADVPIFSCFFGPTLGAPGRAVMKKGGIPTFSFPDQMVRTMSYMVERPKFRKTPVPVSLTPEERARAAQLFEGGKSGSYLTPENCEKLLSLYKIPTAQSVWLSREEEIDALTLRWPVVAKIDHPDIVHKSDVGGVQLHLNSKDELRLLLRRWREQFPGLRGMVVQEEVSGKLELIAGASLDPALGHSLLVGFGGTLVEILNDVAFGHVPLSPEDPDRMLQSLRARKLLEGYRGSRAVNTAQLREILLRLNALLLDFPMIGEMDLNPLVYDESRESFFAVDARIRLS
jgi:acyl-CoA synthetase (NDP forming)/folate-dependent phosphoribosylglycinamide formyltransferase PurN